MLKWSISATLTGLDSQLYNRMTKQVLAFLYNALTLSEHQGHSNWNQTAELSSV